MASPVSPLAPATYPDLPEIPGVRLATAAAGIRYRGRTDVLYVGLDAGTAVAGVFTRSKCPSAPVDWCRANLAGGTACGRSWSFGQNRPTSFTGPGAGRGGRGLAGSPAVRNSGPRARRLPMAGEGLRSWTFDSGVIARSRSTRDESSTMRTGSSKGVLEALAPVRPRGGVRRPCARPPRRAISMTTGTRFPQARPPQRFEIRTSRAR